ncbi:MAG: hypothetical protein HQ582_29990 [Planctomycetes bacterium]|nr:hypothetical protein [Planctomycetota bacterium]
MHPAVNIAALVIAACCTLASQAEGPGASTPFPAKIPWEKPTDRRLSAAVERLYDVWNPHEDRANELYSNFKYSRLDGFSYENNTSRRDPSKVLRLDGTYYVWYTRRQTAGPPAGPQNATDTIPSFDWDLAEIWYATSKDGFHWEERGPAVRRAPEREYGWRSVSTPDVLAWGGKYYLYFQGFDEIPGLKGDRAAATVAEADSPDGPSRPGRLCRTLSRTVATAAASLGACATSTPTGAARPGIPFWPGSTATSPWTWTGRRLRRTICVSRKRPIFKSG